MRVSIEKGDPGLVSMERARRLQILCDGVELERVRTADDELGIAIVVSADKTGKILHNGVEVLTETIRGKIEIREKALA